MAKRLIFMPPQNKIEVVVGTPEEVPEKLVLAYLNDTLVTGENICDH